MSEIVKWSGAGGISFFAKPSEIRGFKDLNITATAETEDSTSDGEKFIKKKNKGSYVIQLTAVLNAALKVDVKKVATAITESARCADTGYFYVGNSKLFPSSFMATEAKISNIRMTGSGVWTYCEVTWTLKQCSKYSGSSSSSGGGGTSKAATTVTKVKQAVETVAKKALEVAKTTATTVLQNAQTAVKKAFNTTSSAKTQSAKILADANTKKTTTSSTTTAKKVTLLESASVKPIAR